MACRWTRSRVEDNGHTLTVWSLGDLEVACNANEGLLGGWKWEVTEDGERVLPLQDSLDAAKRAAEALILGRTQTLELRESA